MLWPKNHILLRPTPTQRMQIMARLTIRRNFNASSLHPPQTSSGLERADIYRYTAPGKIIPMTKKYLTLGDAPGTLRKMHLEMIIYGYLHKDCDSRTDPQKTEQAHG